jgi:hypothetical protein
VTRPRPGDRFTHDKVIEPTWKPDRTQVWSQAPKAEMQVTAVEDGVVHYSYVKPGRDHRHIHFEMPQAVFLDRFDASLRPALTVVDGGGYPELMDRLTDSYNRLRAVPDTD